MQECQGRPSFRNHVFATAECCDGSEIKLLQYGIHCDAVMRGYFAENGAERARLERVVRRNGQMMLACGLRGEPTMGATLPSELVSECPSQGFLQIAGRKVARQLHVRAITSSTTR